LPNKGKEKRGELSLTEKKKKKEALGGGKGLLSMRKEKGDTIKGKEKFFLGGKKRKGKKGKKKRFRTHLPWQKAETSTYEKKSLKKGEGLSLFSRTGKEKKLFLYFRLLR